MVGIFLMAIIVELKHLSLQNHKDYKENIGCKGYISESPPSSFSDNTTLLLLIVCYDFTMQCSRGQGPFTRQWHICQHISILQEAETES